MYSITFITDFKKLQSTNNLLRKTSKLWIFLVHLLFLGFSLLLSSSADWLHSPRGEMSKLLVGWLSALVLYRPLCPQLGCWPGLCSFSLGSTYHALCWECGTNWLRLCWTRAFHDSGAVRGVFGLYIDFCFPWVFPMHLNRFFLFVFCNILWLRKDEVLWLFPVLGIVES